ncbi:hypothetical protein ABT237_23100 [Streptomyces sp. NPDC001581]|uniref:hypothetical protein n=1 Tax=Streptomyces sp. NPDC001581 TaxID=3154386 RepID=UPI003319276B
MRFAVALRHLLFQLWIIRQLDWEFGGFVEQCSQQLVDGDVSILCGVVIRATECCAAQVCKLEAYQSEIARAQGFGARSLNEFKQEHSRQRGGESPSLFMYSFDWRGTRTSGRAHPGEACRQDR